MGWKLAYVTLCLVGITGQAHAQSSRDHGVDAMLGTISAEMIPYRTDGKLSGCQITYVAAMRDYTYSSGRYLHVSGSVSLMTIGGGIGATMKVVVNEIVPSAQGITFKPSPASRLYLVSPDHKTNLESLIRFAPSDTPGGLFAMFRVTPTFEMLLDGLFSGGLTIAFNQNDGESDLILKVDPHVVYTNDNGERQRSGKIAKEFTDCVEVATEAALKETHQ